ncbi:MAG TPA: TetR/AcrR family transcriptional regulator [Solirubrobacteraceae bacterium]
MGINGNRASLAQAKRQGAHVGEMQRRRLLLAIGELLSDDGVEAATVGSISRRAGVSRRTFYEAFEDVEACFLAAFERAIQRISEEVVVARRERTWSDRIRAGLLALLEQLDEQPDLARMCVVETPRAGPAVMARRKRVLAALVAAVDEGRADCKPGDEPLPLTAEGVVGGALSVIHARLLEGDSVPRGTGQPSAPGGSRLADLANPLTGMILHPYLGPVAARHELDRPTPKAPVSTADALKDPFKGLSIRFTYRTARVLATMATEPGASNRSIAERSGIDDEGQMSRLLRRLQTVGLVENCGEGHIRGKPNAWSLTSRGQAIHTTFAGTEKISP